MKQLITYKVFYQINSFTLFSVIWLLNTTICFSSEMVFLPTDEKPRLLILTDIGGDPDDQQSLIRLLLYAHALDIEGIIATAAGTPGELGEAIIRPDLIKEIILAYGKVRDNLTKHQLDYPRADSLLALIKRGNPERGLTTVQQGKLHEGAEWIIQVADRPDPRPLNIAIWGGQSELAQALQKVKSNRSPKEYQEFIARLRIYDIADQDGIYSWMMERFPGLFYVLNKAPEGEDKRNAVFRGMYLGGDESLTSREWIDTHVRKNHGPMGALYPVETWTSPNPHGVMKEGDTPSWFYFLPNGLSDPNHPTYGGWGGRFVPNGTLFTDAQDEAAGTRSAQATVWRWRPHFQRDFQARMDWCVQDYAAANHAPVAAFRGDPGMDIIQIAGKPGETITLSAEGSTDPDGDSLTYAWSVYPEAGTYPSRLDIRNSNRQQAQLVVPKAENSATIHIILSVQDSGEPQLTSYRRIVLTVAGER